MLIKINVEEPFHVEVPPSSKVRVWLVQDQLPLGHQQQLNELCRSLGLSPSDISVDNTGIAFTTPEGKKGLSMDWKKTPGAQGITTATVIWVFSKSAGDSPRRMTTFTTTDDETMTEVDPNETQDLDSGDEEVYASHRIGWFPFVIKEEHGTKVVAVTNPDYEPQDHDTAPNRRTLCSECSPIVAEAERLRHKVDKHYKPTQCNLEVVEGWVEKLGGGSISRWQKRYLRVSEKCVFWYVQQPKIGEKQKTKGARMIHNGQEFTIDEVIENPDPSKHPKCKDSKFFHFGITFRVPTSTMLFRVASLAEKKKFVNYLNDLKNRNSSKATNKDPVLWKRWADRFLTHLAALEDANEYHAEEVEELQHEDAELETTLNAMTEEDKPRIEHKEALDAEASALQMELELLEVLAADERRRVADAAEKVRVAEAQLQLDLDNMAEESRKEDLLRERVKEKCERSQTLLAALKAETQQVKNEAAVFFEKWRKMEEHHREHEPTTRKVLSLSVHRDMSYSPSRSFSHQSHT